MDLLWTPEELKNDNTKKNTLSSEPTTREVETLHLRFPAPQMPTTVDVTYERTAPHIFWRLKSTPKEKHSASLPVEVTICPESVIPIRTAKTHLSFPKTVFATNPPSATHHV